jgi:predicted phage baseplate assembly protein
LPSGQENVTAQYRVGIGSLGSVTAGQLSLLPRRPFGIHGVANPAPSRNWADEETLDEARTTAPQRVRTLARVVSVADHEDVARAFPGVGQARADLVWNGHRDTVVVSVLGTAGAAPGSDLLGDLSTHITAQAADDDRFTVLAGQRLWFGVRVEIVPDTGYALADVQTAVSNALDAAFGPATAGFATGVSRADVLVVVRNVAGVVACTVPRLLEIASVPEPPAVAQVPPDPADPEEVVVALPGRFDDGLQAAQSPALAPGASVVGVMST